MGFDRGQLLLLMSLAMDRWRHCDAMKANGKALGTSDDYWQKESQLAQDTVAQINIEYAKLGPLSVEEAHDSYNRFS